MEISEISVSNGVTHPPNSIEEFRFLSRSPRGEALKRAGTDLILMPNQPDFRLGFR